MNQLLAELQRRHVVRVAVVYVLVGAAILQGATALESALPPLRDWFATVVVSFLIVGFPVALVLAWIFDLSSSGIVRTTDASSAKPARLQLVDWLLASLLVIALTGMVIQMAAQLATRKHSTSTDAHAADATPSDVRTLAVLPFMDLSPVAQGDFSGGITANLIKSLALVHGLGVTGPESTFALEGKSVTVPDIARQLRVSNIVQGSVRMDGDNILVRAELIDAVRDSPRWTGIFDRKGRDVWAIQDDITSAIARALKLPAGETRKAPTQSEAAIRLYFDAQKLFRERAAGPERIRRSIQLLKRAVSLDPKFADAYGSLAANFAVMASRREERQSDWQSQAREAATTALRLNPNLAETEAALGLLNLNELAWAPAFEHLQRALALDPSNTTARFWLGNAYVTTGHISKAAGIIRDAWERDRNYVRLFQWRMRTELFQGNYETAVQLAEDALKEKPTDDPAVIYASQTLAEYSIEQKDWPRAEQFLTQATSLFLATGSSGFEVSKSYIAAYMAALRSPSARRKAVQALKKTAQSYLRFDPAQYLLQIGGDEEFLDQVQALLARGQTSLASSALYFAWDIRFKSVRANPRFKAIVQEMHLVDYWRVAGWPDRCEAKGATDFVCDR